MSVHTVLQYSPNLSKAPNSPRRRLLPSPPPKCLPGLTMILPKKQNSSTEAGSPVRKSRKEPGEGNLVDFFPIDHFSSTLASKTIEHEFDVLLEKPNPDFIQVVATSNRITLSFSLIKNGRYMGPPKDGFTELASLFPTTFAVEVRPPFLLFRVRTIPPKPWPLSVAGLPPRFTTNEFKPGWDIGKAGRGPKLLSQYNLQRKDEFSDAVLNDAINSLVEHKLNFVDLRWYGAFWVVTLTDKEINLSQNAFFSCWARMLLSGLRK